MSYYRVNSDLLFRKKSSVFDQQLTLTEIEDMIPFERDIYLIMIMQKIEQHKQESSK